MPLTTYSPGQVLTAASLNANFTFAASDIRTVAIFNETQASATNGGTFTSGSFVKRTLNTTVVNTISGCSLASSVITLTAGTYIVQAFAPAFQVDSHKVRLQNTTAGTTLIFGINAYVGSGTLATTIAILNTTFTIAGSTNIELQHQCQTTKATTGFGGAASFASTSEIYAQIQILQVA